MSNRIPIPRVIDAVSPDRGRIREAVRVLLAGKLVAYPTDTLYALGADPRAAAAVEHLFRAKKRSQAQGIPLVAADVTQVEACVGRLSPLGVRLAALFWPGPLTMVVDAGPTLSAGLLGDSSSVAVRVPDQAIACALASELGYPITATSANVSGTASATTAEAAVEAFGAELAMVLDGGPTGEVPSTIVDVRNRSPVLLRAGVIPWERVLQSIT